jgi:hypothetical protein
MCLSPRTLDPIFHHPRDLPVLEVNDVDAAGSEEVFAAYEIGVFGHDEEGDFVQQAGARAPGGEGGLAMVRVVRVG